MHHLTAHISIHTPSTNPAVQITGAFPLPFKQSTSGTHTHTKSLPLITAERPEIYNAYTYKSTRVPFTGRKQQTNAGVTVIVVEVRRWKLHKSKQSHVCMSMQDAAQHEWHVYNCRKLSNVTFYIEMMFLIVRFNYLLIFISSVHFSSVSCSGCRKV